MPRGVVRITSGTLISNITVLSLTPPAGGQFSLLSVEMMLRYDPSTVIPKDNGGNIDIVMATSVGTSPSTLTPIQCDPASAALQTTAKFNYASDPSKAAGPLYKVACPPRTPQYLSWDEGELVVSGTNPLLFVHNTGASMPSQSVYAITAEWSE